MIIHKKKEIAYVECKEAGIAQVFLTKDIPALLDDLGNLIESENKYIWRRSLQQKCSR